MQKNKKTIIILIVLFALATLILVVMFRSEQAALIEDLNQLEIMEGVYEINETDTLDRIGSGDEVEDIEDDLRILDEELDEISRLLNDLEMEIDEL